MLNMLYLLYIFSATFCKVNHYLRKDLWLVEGYQVYTNYTVLNQQYCVHVRTAATGLPHCVLHAVTIVSECRRLCISSCCFDGVKVGLDLVFVVCVI